MAPAESPAIARLTRVDPYAAARKRMVDEQLAGPGRGIASAAVLGAMRQVPRHHFVPLEWLTNSYVDTVLVFRRGIVLEAPYVIAVTAEQLAAQPDDRVLDVESGTGYDAAIFSLLVREVYVTESLPLLADAVRAGLAPLGFTNNVFTRVADVAQGWPEAAPFDTIVFNLPLARFPDNLLRQLKDGGRVIIPVDDNGQMQLLKKSGARLVRQTSLPVRPTPIPGNQLDLHDWPVILRPAP